MVDRLTRQARSRNMGRIRGKDTKPELIVRKLLWAAGLRYRLHARNLPGTPDVVFRRRRKVILVHGCFWHRHTACRMAYEPKSRREFWASKFAATVARDQRNLQALRELGWDVLIVWECEIPAQHELRARLVKFVDPGVQE